MAREILSLDLNEKMTMHEDVLNECHENNELAFAIKKLLEERASLYPAKIPDIIHRELRMNGMEATYWAYDLHEHEVF